jgi:hypothetical protein
MKVTSLTPLVIAAMSLRTRHRRAPKEPDKFRRASQTLGALVDTRVIYCGDNLAQFQLIAEIHKFPALPD